MNLNAKNTFHTLISSIILLVMVSIQVFQFHHAIDPDQHTPHASDEAQHGSLEGSCPICDYLIHTQSKQMLHQAYIDLMPLVRVYSAPIGTYAIESRLAHVMLCGDRGPPLSC